MGERAAVEEWLQYEARLQEKQRLSDGARGDRLMPDQIRFEGRTPAAEDVPRVAASETTEGRS